MLPATFAVAAAGGRLRQRAGGALHPAARRVRPRAQPAAPTNRRTFFSFGNAAPPPSTEELFKRVRALHESVLKPNNTRYLGPLGRDTDELIPLPVVLVVGNHSAGKSTFINYVLGRQVQSTGVAPTDDSFTLVAPGQADADQDGPSLVGDPTWGLGGLRQFGTQLINHVSLKIRSGTALKDVLIVDSPGMIDAPVSPAHAGGSGGHLYRDKSRDRGYDFPATMRWFAERADLILLFQDPAKPGTTGETLDIMTTALAGQDFKTLIVLNKADVFTNVHDFARAYGALTWNLSKVIPRKDLPPIYTMCVPVDGNRGEGAHGTNSSAAGRAGSSGGSIKDALADLAATRAEIVGEVQKAPLRRVDNMITRLYDSARLLRMHAAVMSAAKREYMGDVAKYVGAVGGVAAGLGGLAGSLFWTGSVELAAPLAAGALLATGGGGWWAARTLAARSAHYTEGPGLDDVFRRVYFMQLADRDEFVAQLWERVRPQLQTALRTLGLRGVPFARRGDLLALDDIVDKEVPALRQAATKAGALYSSGGGGGGNASAAAAGGDKGAAPAAAAAAKAPPAASAPGGAAAAPGGRR